MLNLVHIQNDQAVVSSRQVAEHFEKNHRDVLRSIKNICETIARVKKNSMLKNDSAYSTERNFAPSEFSKFFFETSYKDASGKSNREYLMNRDGFSLLVMGFTGDAAMEWKLAYIQAFDAMEAQLMNARNDQFVGLGDDEIKILRAIKFAEELSKTLFWLAKSESAAKKLAVECAARHFNLNIELFSFMLSNTAESEVFNVTEIGRILKIEANDVNRILRKMKFQRLFRRKWIPIGKGLDFAVFDTYTKWKASIIEHIEKFLQERSDD